MLLFRYNTIVSHEAEVSPRVLSDGDGIRTVNAETSSPDESTRLNTLYNYRILDTPAETAFDTLVRLAAQICHAPIAQLAFLDEQRQWNKSSVGWDIREIARTDSLTWHALEQKDIFIVPDLSQDERFAQNPFVSELPQLRFYAGMPLLTEAGLVLGVLCVMDTTPRSLTEDESSAMEMLARQTMALLEQRRQINVLSGEVTVRSDAEGEALKQARRDMLTGLPNRMLFLERVDEALRVAQGMREARKEKAHGEVALLFVDLDRFKRINDTLGHAAGDIILREVAARFSGALRPEDTLARIGGDEFTVLMPDLPTANYADVVSQMLLRTLARPIMLQGQEFSVGASIGISVFPRDGDDAATLLKHADIAMYQAKAKGGYQAYSPQMNADGYQRLLEESELRRAIERDELTLYYQPLLEMETGRVAAVEALARWRHPERGPVPPAHFIELAEQADLIVDLGEWVLRRACKDAARFRRDGLTELRVSINLSARHLMHGSLLGTIQGLMKEYDIPGDMLDLELTETALCTTGDTTPHTLQVLREMGVRLSVDDFGTGYSSLAYLRRFPVDILKIDRAFVAGLGKDTPDAALIRACVEMAHALKLLVVAEGVETEVQRDLLRSLGCDLAQGYLFSRPVPPESLRTLLGEKGLRSAMLLTSGGVSADVSRLARARTGLTASRTKRKAA